MSFNYTPIGHAYVINEREEEDVCYCDWEDSIDYWESDSDYCLCGKRNSDPLVTVRKIRVRVVGNPVRFKPEDCAYNICVWTMKLPESEAQCSEWKFDEAKLEDSKEEVEYIEVTIQSTVDPIDLETQYGKMAREYLKKGIIDSSNYEKGFRAPVGINKYRSHYFKIIDNIINPAGVREQSENAHVKARKGGMSHYVPKHFIDRKSKKKDKVKARKEKRAKMRKLRK